MCLGQGALQICRATSRCLLHSAPPRPQVRIELDAAMAEMDADNSGEVDKAEFSAWWTRRSLEGTEAAKQEYLDRVLADEGAALGQRIGKRHVVEEAVKQREALSRAATHIQKTFRGIVARRLHAMFVLEQNAANAEAQDWHRARSHTLIVSQMAAHAAAPESDDGSTTEEEEGHEEGEKGRKLRYWHMAARAVSSTAAFRGERAAAHLDQRIGGILRRLTNAEPAELQALCDRSHLSVRAEDASSQLKELGGLVLLRAALGDVTVAEVWGAVRAARKAPSAPLWEVALADAEAPPDALEALRGRARALVLNHNPVQRRDLAEELEQAEIPQLQAMAAKLAATMDHGREEVPAQEAALRLAAHSLQRMQAQHPETQARERRERRRRRRERRQEEESRLRAEQKDDELAALAEERERRREARRDEKAAARALVGGAAYREEMRLKREAEEQRKQEDAAKALALATTAAKTQAAAKPTAKDGQPEAQPKQGVYTSRPARRRERKGGAESRSEARARAKAMAKQRPVPPPAVQVTLQQETESDEEYADDDDDNDNDSRSSSVLSFSSVTAVEKRARRGSRRRRGSKSLVPTFDLLELFGRRARAMVATPGHDMLHPLLKPPGEGPSPLGPAALTPRGSTGGPGVPVLRQGHGIVAPLSAPQLRRQQQAASGAAWKSRHVALPTDLAPTDPNRTVVVRPRRRDTRAEGDLALGIAAERQRLDATTTLSLIRHSAREEMETVALGRQALRDGVQQGSQSARGAGGDWRDGFRLSSPKGPLSQAPVPPRFIRQIRTPYRGAAAAAAAGLAGEDSASEAGNAAGDRQVLRLSHRPPAA